MSIKVDYVQWGYCPFIITVRITIIIYNTIGFE